MSYLKFCLGVAYARFQDFSTAAFGLNRPGFAGDRLV